MHAIHNEANSSNFWPFLKFYKLNNQSHTSRLVHNFFSFRFNSSQLQRLRLFIEVNHDQQ